MHTLLQFLTVTAFSCCLLFATPTSGIAQESHDMHHCEEDGTCALNFVDEAEEVPFGTYSYRHQYLHGLGVIDRLLNATKKSCCDGGMGGECRATELSPDGRHFKHGSRWCPLAPGQVIHTNIGLPNDVQAVVCAPNSSVDICPETTYCVAASLSG